MLWIALHLPLLSLEAFAATLTHEQAGAPLALVDAHHIAAANAAARALGVEPGQKRATALALAPDLLIGQADAARDAAFGADDQYQIQSAALTIAKTSTVASSSAARPVPRTLPRPPSTTMTTASMERLKSKLVGSMAPTEWAMRPPARCRAASPRGSARR